MALIKMLEKTAPQKPMETPGIIQMVKATIAVLTTRMKKPRVVMMRGRERMVTMGFMMELTREKMSPAVMKIQGSYGETRLPNNMIHSHMPVEDTSQRKTKEAVCCLIM